MMDELQQAELARRAKQAAENSPWISLQEISQAYGISIRTLRRMQAEGLMPPRTKRGRFLMYKKSEINNVIAVGRRAMRQAER
jgi:predicted DNA-binding transcriptional regulator AlpA